MKKILGFLFVLVVLVGCSGGSVKNTVCKGEIGGANVSYEFDSKGNKVTKMTLQGEEDVSSLTDEEVQQYIDQANSLFGSIDGITFTTSTSDDKKLTTKIVIDCTVADLEKLKDMGFVEDEDIDYIGLSETIKSLESDGLTCK